MAIKLGAHISVAGGLPLAFERAAELDCDTIQLFVKSPNRWAAKPLEEGVADDFRRAHQASPVGPVVAHAAYLINLAAIDREILEKSRRALADELERCARLGVGALVVHPGAHMGAGEESGLERISESLDAVLSEVPGGEAKLLLENTAGQGTTLGYRLEQLAAMREATRAPEAVGICLDTCHAFAAGYPLHEDAGYEEFFGRFFELFSPDDLGCLHLNDSLRPFASRRDRHANIGEGEMGLGVFRRLLDDSRLQGVPMILETPLGDDKLGHRRDLDHLRTCLERSADIHHRLPAGC